MSRLVVSLLGLVAAAGSTVADPVRPDSIAAEPPPSRTRIGHGLLLPLGSVVIPGLGQWTQHAGGEGLAFFGVAVTGLFIGAANLRDAETDEDDQLLSRDPDTQLGLIGYRAMLTSGFLSGYDSYRRSLPGLQAGDHYGFVTRPPPSVGQSLLAPFRFGYLRNLRTWAFLAIPTVLVTAALIDDDGPRAPFELHDGAFALATSYGAGVGEEAFFRGYLLPFFHDLYGERALLANLTQATIFGLAHLSSTSVPVGQFLVGLYFGWQTKRAGWDFRETIFQHTWWNAIVITGALLLDEPESASVRLQLPTIRF